MDKPDAPKASTAVDTAPKDGPGKASLLPPRRRYVQIVTMKISEVVLSRPGPTAGRQSNARTAATTSRA